MITINEENINAVPQTVRVKKVARMHNKILEIPEKASNKHTELNKTATVFTEDSNTKYRIIYEFDKED